MSSGISNGSGMINGTHHISLEYQKRLEPLIGVLSRFIVEKALHRCMEGSNILELERTFGMIDDINGESILLIGPTRANSLKEEMIILTKDYYQEDMI
ncbi:MAG: hypothetical protein U9R75_03910 [Candidatus Thermoplasmatota archaeon]|nr:hypothetical protein [Candidatus Thermoplasmatota archaeon]